MSTQAERLLREAREELVRAENKASLLLTASGVGVGALMAALLSKSWTPTGMTGVAQISWWLGIIFLTGSLSLLGFAIYPRTTAGKRQVVDGVAYYGDVVQVGRAGLSEALRNTATEEALTDQLFNVSEIVVSKYNAIRRSLWGLAAGVALVIASVGLNVIG